MGEKIFKQPGEIKFATFRGQDFKKGPAENGHKLVGNKVAEAKPDHKCKKTFDEARAELFDMIKKSHLSGSG